MNLGIRSIAPAAQHDRQVPNQKTAASQKRFRPFKTLSEFTKYCGCCKQSAAPLILTPATPGAVFANARERGRRPWA